MSKSPASLPTLFSPHASLAALAAQLKARGILDRLRQGVQIAQKTVKDSPQDKLIDILLTLLCGGTSLVQINTLLRSVNVIIKWLLRSLADPKCDILRS